jgi:hypothetical protein
MNILIKHICFGAALALTALPHNVAAQQVIAKGDWVLENPAAPGYGQLGVFSTAKACVAGQHEMNAEAAQSYHQAVANYKDLTNRETVEWNESHQFITSDEVAKGSRLNDALQNAYNLWQVVSGANCIQQ